MATQSTDDGSAGTIQLLRQNIPPRYYVGFVAFLVLAALPLGLSTVKILTMTAALYFAMFVVSWDFVSGYTGQVSFGHTLFFGVGGYTAALLNLEFGLSPVLTVIAGVLLTTVAGLMVGLPALRLHGHYLALITLLPPLVLIRFFSLYRSTFGGETGLPNPDNLIEVQGDFAATALVNYYLGLVIFAFIFLIAFVITRSDHGITYTAIQENEDAVSSVGINPAKFKLFAFVMSAALAGFAGAMFVHTPIGSASPSQLLELTVMIEILIAAILGGVGTISGAAVGAIFIYLARDYIRGIDTVVPILDMPVTRMDTFLFYVLMLGMLFFLPGGLLPKLTEYGRKVHARVTGGSPEAVTDGGYQQPAFVRKIEAYRARVLEKLAALLRRDN
ncbi:branched-chain amino acid ABC transporter permease [Natrialbaceae archaeon A-CW2]|uniref:branched-chain amino acid ABC transporter permease n=1 Tax=Natronosalvus amylolyticus TaxID=2961994 RepID=UPI0020C95BDE|nr:branched-chain amino acid ABC transporter permease [Natronosalvus amylolyticus]